MATKSKKIWLIIPENNPEQAKTVGAKKLLIEKYGLTWRQAYQKTFPQLINGNWIVQSATETYSRKNK